VEWALITTFSTFRKGGAKTQKHFPRIFILVLLFYKGKTKSTAFGSTFSKGGKGY
jgi:hypothetical protein